MTVYYADPAAEINVPIKSRTDGGQHILARDIERLPGTVETDIAQSRTFLETLAESVTAGRLAVDLSGTVGGYLQSLAGAVTAAKLQTDVLSLPGTVAADIATLATAIASGSMKAVLQAGTNVIGKLAANVGVNIGTVDVATVTGNVAVTLPATPTANLATIASDTTFLRTYNPSLAAGSNLIGKVQPSDGTNHVAVKAASTAAAAADPALVVSLSPNGALPVGSNLIGKVQPSDGTNHVAVKAASTVPAAADPAMVVSISPNGPAAPTTTVSGTLNVGGATLTMALHGRQTAVLTISSGTLTGTLAFHHSFDGGGQFVTGLAISHISRTRVSSVVNPSSSSIYYFILPPGITHVRAVVSAYTSGGINAAISASSSLGDYINIGQWFDSPAPTVGQKTMADSIPIVIASNQSNLPVVLAAGSSNIGDVDVLTLPSLPAGTNNIGDVDVASIAFTDATASGTLGALNATATVALAGKSGAGIQIASGTTLVGTLTPEVSFDGGTTYGAAAFFDAATGAVAATLAVTSGNAVARSIVVPGGASHARVRVSAYTSGSATGNIRATEGSAALQYTTPAKPTTSTVTSVTSVATASTQLLAANSARLGATLYNESTSTCSVKFGASASQTSYSVRMGANTYFEVPFGYTGVINASWAAANGAMRITEMT